MRTFTVNYLERDGGRRRGHLVSVGFFAHDLPRLIPLCRLLGHRPVVDGTDPIRQDQTRYIGQSHRWVCCDRCGVRGEPQGDLDPAVWAVGDRYTGPWDDTPHTDDIPAGSLEQVAAKMAQRAKARGYTLPGRIGARPRGQLGGQLVIGGAYGGVGWEVKVGNASSEHTLAASLKLGWLGALYLHTERFGTGVQRRLNPVGYESKITRFHITGRGVEWKIWSKRDSGSRYGPDREPWWRNGELDLRVRDRLWGPKRYSYTDVDGGTVTRVVRMPEADYLVQLKLRRVSHGRRRGRKTFTWAVDWNTLGRGIPTKAPDRGRILGAGVDVPDRAVRAGTWPAEAAAAIAADMVRHRTSYDWDPNGRVPVDVEAAA